MKGDGIDPADEFRGVERDLDALGAVERAMLRESRDIGDAPGLDRVESTLRAAMLDSDFKRAKAVRSKRMAIVVSLLAASLLVFTWYRTDDEDEIPSQRMGEGLQILDPVVGEHPYARVRWRYTGNSAARFVVQVFDLREHLVAQYEAGSSSEFVFDEAETIQWPSSIVIVIVVGVQRPDGSLAQSSERTLRSRP